MRKLTTWYTNRTPIDIEIVGSTSLVPDMHRLEPERRLRLRLERAYVQDFHTGQRPGFEIVSLAFDMTTGLPESLLSAAAGPGSPQDSDIPRVSRRELSRRSISVTLQSDSSLNALQTHSAKLQKCRGEIVGEGLWTYRPRASEGCLDYGYPRSLEYVASLDSELLILIRCREAEFDGLGCTLRFPFEGFAAAIMFHRSHHLHWREVIERTRIFLASKQYR